MKILLSNCLLTYVQRLSHSLVVVFWIPSLLTKVVFNVDEEDFPVLLSTRTIKQIFSSFHLSIGRNKFQIVAPIMLVFLHWLVDSTDGWNVLFEISAQAHIQQLSLNHSYIFNGSPELNAPHPLSLFYFFSQQRMNPLYNRKYLWQFMDAAIINAINPYNGKSSSSLPISSASFPFYQRTYLLVQFFQYIFLNIEYREYHHFTYSSNQQSNAPAAALSIFQFLDFVHFFHLLCQAFTVIVSSA